MTESRDSEQVSPEQRLRKALENRDAKAARRILDAMHDADIAAVLAETAVEGERSRIWDLLPYKRWEGITGLLGDRNLRATRKRRLLHALALGKLKRARRLLAPMGAVKIAGLLNTVTASQREQIWNLLDADLETEVMPLLKRKVAAAITRLVEASAHEEAEEAPAPRTDLEQVRRALKRGKFRRVQRVLKGMRPAEIANLLESLPPTERSVTWALLDTRRGGEVLVNLHQEARLGLIRETDADELVAAAEDMPLEDLAELVHDLPAAVSDELRLGLDQRDRQRLERKLSYPEDSAGGLMDPDVVTVRADVPLGVVLRYLRKRARLPDHSNHLIAVDRDGHYIGMLPLARLLTSPGATALTELVDTDVKAVAAHTPADEVARLFDRWEVAAVAVVDDDGSVIGQISADDVVEQVLDDAEHDFMNMAGLDEQEDMFAPLVTSARRRALWLGINLVTAFLAAWVIGLFEGTLEQFVALAVLMPIVASMGGIAGSQTLTLMIRGLALGQVQTGNLRLLLSREVGIGLLNGMVWALVVAALAVLWFGNLAIGVIIAAAILINLLCAALSGVVIPLVMRRLGIDPALAGGVVLTTVTDVVGFFAFLGLATLYLV